MNKYKVIIFGAVICLLTLSSIQSQIFAAGENTLVQKNIATLKKTKACPGCDLKGAVLERMDLSNANLQGADLTGAKLFLSNLSDANLRNTHLEKAVFGGADLAGADLRGANLNGADLSTAYIAGAKFDGEFIKTKPYEKDGIPEIEKKTYVDDTVRVKKINQDHNIKQSEKNGSNTLNTKKSNIASVGEKDDKNSDNTKEKIADEKTKQKLTANDENALLEKQSEQTAPPVKTVQPIKKVNVHDKISSPENIAIKKKGDEGNDISKIEKIKQQKTGAIKEEDNYQAKEKTEHAAANVIASASESSDVSVNEAKIKPGTSRENGSQEVSAPKKIEESSKVEKLPDNNQKITEKDIPIAGKTLKGQESKTSVAGNKGKANDKEKELKRLLDKNECYHCDLSGLDLSGKNFNGADLEGADFTGCNLENTDFSESILRGAIFENANLKNADLEKADLYKANFSGADLTGADLEGAKTDETNFDGAIGIHKQENK
jgi:uncharacterized protein YjbI with pentapeptide repeats